MQPANSRAPAPRSPSPGCLVIHAAWGTATELRPSPPRRHPTSQPPDPHPRLSAPSSRRWGRRRRAGEIPAAGGRGDPVRHPGIPLQHHSPPPPLRREGRGGGGGGGGHPRPPAGGCFHRRSRKERRMGMKDAGRGGGWAAGGAAGRCCSFRAEPEPPPAERGFAGGSTAGQPPAPPGRCFLHGSFAGDAASAPAQAAVPSPGCGPQPGWHLEGAAAGAKPTCNPGGGYPDRRT